MGRKVPAGPLAKPPTTVGKLSASKPGGMSSENSIWIPGADSVVPALKKPPGASRMLEVLKPFQMPAAALIWLTTAASVSPGYILDGPAAETKNGTVLLDSVFRSKRATIGV